MPVLIAFVVKIPLVKKESIMSDAHKVDEALMKEVIITWLFKFGHDVISHSTMINEMLDEYGSLDVDDAFDECCDVGYISKLQDPFTRIHNYKIADEGLIFLNKGGKYEQQDNNSNKH
jgi:hypothetical protein